MRTSTLHTIVLLSAAFLLGSCATTEEDRIGDSIESLADALDDRDTAAAARLFSDGRLSAVNAVGDSSAIYRLFLIPGSEGFEVDGIEAIVLDRTARALFNLRGDVIRGDEEVGTMTMRIGIDLVKEGDQWRFVSGSETQASGM